MRNLTVREAIVEYLKLHPGSKPATIKLNTNKPMDQVYTTLSKMVKQNIVRRRNGSYTLINTVPMTTINTGEAVEVQLPTTSVNPVANVMRKTEAENKRMHAEIESLKDQLQDLSVKYYDALAVINYLEKLFSLKK